MHSFVILSKMLVLAGNL